MAVPREDEEAAGSVDVERVVHRVIRVHLVDEPDLHSLAYGERPGDGVVLGPALPVDELPDHVGGVRSTVDLRHQVLPLKTVAMITMFMSAMFVRAMHRGADQESHHRLHCLTYPLPNMTNVRVRRGQGIGRHQLHPALRARCWLSGRDLRVHGTNVGTGSRHLRLHGYQPHRTLWASPRPGGGYLWMHGAGVGGGSLDLFSVKERH